MNLADIKFKIRRAINRFLLRHLPPCKDLVHVLSASLDRKLTLHEKIVMKLHLYACKPCVRYFEQSTFLSKAASQLDEKQKDAFYAGRLSDSARKRIKDMMQALATVAAVSSSIILAYLNYAMV
jgi:hypothetical protein